MKKVRFWIQDFFGFSPKETSGFLLLMCLIFFVLILPLFVKSQLSAPDTSDSDRRKLDELLASLESNSYTSASDSQDIVPALKLDRFNPNTASEMDLANLGLEEKIVRRIVNYRNKGGRFLTKNDFKKIYGLSEEKFLQLHPFIDLPEKKYFHKNSSFTASTASKKFPEKEAKSEKYLLPFDINTADSVELMGIKGIGSKLSKRIINYRSKLGGFVSKDQYREIYGLDSTVIEKLGKATFLSPDFTPDKIRINTSSLEELKSHPYISYSTAKTIVAYREQHGPFTAVSDLKKIHNIAPYLFTKLEPYLEL